MVITFNGWMLIISWVLILAVTIGLMIVEEREDKFDERNAQISKAQRHRLVQDAVQEKINQDWRDVK